MDRTRDPAPQPCPELQQVIEVWERGAAAIPWDTPPVDFFEAEARDGESPTDEPWTFAGFDGRVRGFLTHPDVDDAVQFGSVTYHRPTERMLAATMAEGSAIDRLRALVVLVRVRAPRTVDDQWRVLNELRQREHAAEFAVVTDRMMTAFSPGAIDQALAREPGGSRYGTPAPYQWAIRAAGVTQHRAALSRLTELSCSDALHVSLAAMRSLQDFEGNDANAALAECVRGWQYDAALGAAHALLVRDPERLRRTLLDSEPPEEMRCYKGTLLAELEDPRAVPILCETVPTRAIMDRAMFDAIERLALAEHWVAIAGLPRRVRDEQRERAEQIVEHVLARLGLPR
ncbi:MAG: hypothetical protein JNL08_20900 [Planctomycetes bacterium]|nr:hypothetical protein [Planctomycetota bacterium]